MAFFCSTFRAQDFCLVLAFTALVFSFYSTYVYQVSVLRLHIACFFMMSMSTNNHHHFQTNFFRPDLLSSSSANFAFRLSCSPFTFFCVCHITSGYYWINQIQSNRSDGQHHSPLSSSYKECVSKNLFQPFFVSYLYKTMPILLFIAVSPVYYYLYKRSALKMSDPRFYENMEWVSECLSIKWEKYTHHTHTSINQRQFYIVD